MQNDNTRKLENYASFNFCMNYKNVHRYHEEYHLEKDYVCLCMTMYDYV